MPARAAAQISGPWPGNRLFWPKYRYADAGRGDAIDMVKSEQPVTIKQYANRRLYNPGIGAYVTVADLADMVGDDEDFVVYEAKTGEDITRLILKQIIVERAHHG